MYISPKKLKEARDLFHHLLSKKTIESEWQKFFTKHPYAITPSIPLRIEPNDIIPLGRPGKTEPDFIFYPKNIAPVQFYGVIELKRPDQKIVTRPRKNVAILSRNAQTAVEQTIQYAKMVPNQIKAPLAGNHLFLGNDLYLFVVMGLSENETVWNSDSPFIESIRDCLPGNLTILPYDTLLKNFEKHTFSNISILLPHWEISKEKHAKAEEKNVVLSIFDERGVAIISYELQGLPTYGNAPTPRASDGHVVDRICDNKKEAQEYVLEVFPHLKIIDKTSE